MARPQLGEFAREHGLRFITVAQIVAYRLRHERLVRRIAEATLPTPYGEFQLIAYENQVDRREHVALVKGQLEGRKNVLVRMHSECLTGDVFHSLRCDCGEQLHAALRRIDEAGGRDEHAAGGPVSAGQQGAGLRAGMRDRTCRRRGLGLSRTARLRRGRSILLDLGLSSIRLLTSNPRKIVGLEGYGLRVTGREPIQVVPGAFNRGYLETKRSKLGHLLEGA
jgi:3,4-dihydroxy 2-butanone 4-phosphate synthase/GTP cyclohydrolase II